jgi:hypothetical protein
MMSDGSHIRLVKRSLRRTCSCSVEPPGEYCATIALASVSSSQPAYSSSSSSPAARRLFAVRGGTLFEPALLRLTPALLLTRDCTGCCLMSQPWTSGTTLLASPVSVMTLRFSTGFSPSQCLKGLCLSAADLSLPLVRAAMSSESAFVTKPSSRH